MFIESKCLDIPNNGRRWPIVWTMDMIQMRHRIFVNCTCQILVPVSLVNSAGEDFCTSINDINSCIKASVQNLQEPDKFSRKLGPTSCNMFETHLSPSGSTIHSSWLLPSVFLHWHSFLLSLISFELIIHLFFCRTDFLVIFFKNFHPAQIFLQPCSYRLVNLSCMYTQSGHESWSAIDLNRPSLSDGRFRHVSHLGRWMGVISTLTDKRPFGFRLGKSPRACPGTGVVE